ncbi:hypothetical protein B0H12DRAFT_1154068, partial [Mycena haematopus]
PELDQSAFTTTKRKHEEETAVDMPLPRVGLPVFVMQCKAQAQHEQNRTNAGKEQQPSLLGPPLKRRCTGERSDDRPTCVARRASTNANGAVVCAAAVPSSEEAGPDAPVVAGPVSSSSRRSSILGA